MKKLSVIIPVLNEEKTIEAVLKEAYFIQTLGYSKEIIVVNDGSTDNTSNILKNLKKDLDFILLEHEKNKGKGSAIKTALKNTSGDWVIIQDADKEYDPRDWIKLLEESEKHPPSVSIYGSRNIGDRERGYLHFAFGVWILSNLVNFLFKTKLTDSYTCFKLMPIYIIKNINIESQGFEFEAEVTVKMLKKGVKIKEIPISYKPRGFKEGKKIKARDGVKGLWAILKWKFKN